LRLLYNLSFDPELRRDIVETDMIPALAEVLQNEAARPFALRILYCISGDRLSSSKGKTALNRIVPVVSNLIINCPNKMVDPEAIALAINLSLDPSNGRIFVGNDGSGLYNMVCGFCCGSSLLACSHVVTVSKIYLLCLAFDCSCPLYCLGKS